MRRLIDAESLKELFPDNGEGSWTYNATAKAYIDAQPTIHPDTTTHDSIPAETGKNDGDKTSGDCISRQQAIEALKEKVFHNLSDEFYGAMQVLDELPSVQQEIIRCKDCKYYKYGICMKIGANKSFYGFCDWAERGEQE